MSSVNLAFLLGHVGRDPELRYTQSGQAVATFSLATNEQWKDDKGELQKKTEWHRVVAWGRLAEICGQYVTKGMLVHVEGRVATREWTDKQDRKQRVTEIVARSVQFLGARGESGTGTASSDAAGDDAESQPKQASGRSWRKRG